jgi:hypothetical protein
MSEFNPYHQWLGISETERPISKYRLLGIDEFESDRGVISAAAEQRTIYLRTMQAGEHAVLVAELLNEVSQARVTLLNADQKTAYDEELRKQQTPAPVPDPTPPPIPVVQTPAPLHNIPLPTPVADREPIAQNRPQAMTAEWSTFQTVKEPQIKAQKRNWKRPAVVGISVVGVIGVFVLLMSIMSSGDADPVASYSAPTGTSPTIPSREPEPQLEDDVKTPIKAVKPSIAIGVRKQIAESHHRFTGHDGKVNSVAFSPDGERLVSGGGDNFIRVWDARTRKELLAIRGHSDQVTSVVFSPDGNCVASVGDDGTIKIWNAETGILLRTFHGHLPTGLLTSVAFSPDGTRLVSGGHDQAIKVWDAHTGKELFTLKGFDHIYSIAFSPDGKRFVSGGGDNCVRVFNTQNGRQIHVLMTHTARVNSVAFSSDGMRIASGGRDGCISVWDAETGEELLTLNSTIVKCVVFSPDGRRLVSGHDDRSIKIWDAQTGKELISVDVGSRSCLSIAICPDGKYIVRGSYWADIDILDLSGI